MNGARQAGSYGLAPLADGMGLFIATPSYNGKMSFNVISTREILPDIEFFMESLRQSRDELLEALQSLSGKKKPVRKKRAAKIKAKKTATS